MKQHKEMPLEGSFVAIWEFDDQLWAKHFEWRKDKLFVYEQYQEDEFNPVNHLKVFPFDQDPTYFTKE